MSTTTTNANQTNKQPVKYNAANFHNPWFTASIVVAIVLLLVLLIIGIEWMMKKFRCRGPVTVTPQIDI